jgi:hypothetical protein
VCRSFEVAAAAKMRWTRRHNRFCCDAAAAAAAFIDRHIWNDRRVNLRICVTRQASHFAS